MSDPDFDNDLSEIRTLVAGRAADLDARWAELVAAVGELAVEARKVGRDVESRFVTVEEGGFNDPPVEGQLVINRKDEGFWIPDPYSDDPHGLYGKWLDLADVAADYRILILRAELHRSLATRLLDTLRVDHETLQRPISKQLLSRPEPDAGAVAERLGWTRVVERWRQAQSRGSSRPAEAITLARSLIEDVVKHILDGTDTPAPSELKKATRLALKALGQDTDMSDKLRGGLDTLEQAVFSARNDMSTAHGSGPNDRAPTGAEAQLLVTVAGGLAAYLMTLYLERSGTT